MADDEPQAPSHVQSVERALDLLEALAASPTEQGVSALGAKVELPYATIHRLLTTLVSRGYVRRVSSSRKYLLGPQLVPLGDAANKVFRGWTTPYLKQLAEMSGETANLALLDDTHAVYLAQVPSRHQLRMFTEVGNRVLPHSTAIGKVLLAYSDEAEIERVIRTNGLPAYTENTITDRAGFFAALKTAREEGYAIDEQEQELGVVCIAVPIVSGERPVAAVSISGPAGRLGPEQRERIIPNMQAIAKDLENEWYAQQAA